MTLDYGQIAPLILEFEQKGLVTRTFRRLDPARQQAVIAAILEEASESGPTALNIKRVAERAGVAIGSLYQYFSSRQGLLDFATALVVRSVVELFNSVRPYFAETPLREGLAGFVTGGLEWSKEQANLARFFARAAYHGDPELAESVVRPIATVLRELVHDFLQQAIARGEVRPDIDLEATSRVVYGLTIAVADPQLLPYLNNYFQVLDPEVPPERLMEAFLNLVSYGIATPPEPKRAVLPKRKRARAHS